MAEEGETIVGMRSPSSGRGTGSAQLGTVPGRQGRGVGRDLLKLALAHGEPDSPGTIQCSNDPKAMALYTGFGFTLHPVVTGWGAIRPGAVTRPPDVDRYEADQVRERELEVVTAMDRASAAVRPRTIDIVAMLAQPGNHLLLHGDQAYAVAKSRAHRDARCVSGGVGCAGAAHDVGRGAPPAETIEVNWLTSAQQWAVREVVAAGIKLRPYGPVMVRGMDGPPSPYIPSGGFG